VLYNLFEDVVFFRIALPLSIELSSEKLLVFELNIKPAERFDLDDRFQSENESSGSSIQRLGLIVNELPSKSFQDPPGPFDLPMQI